MRLWIGGGDLNEGGLVVSNCAGAVSVLVVGRQKEVVGGCQDEK